MKRKITGFILGLGVVAALSTAYTLQAKAVEPADIRAEESIAVDAPSEEIYHGMGMINPWVDSDQAGVREATGFDLAAPEGATNVAYSYMPSTGMAQLNYTMDNAMWVYRMQPADALEDISGVYCEWNYTVETKVSGMDAMEYSYASETEGGFIDGMECVRVINWYDAQNKVTYSLSVLGTDLNGMDAVVYAENLFNPGANLIDAPESDGIGPIREEDAKGLFETDLYKFYLGLHVSSYDGSEIMVEEGEEEGRLKVNVSIFRLCTLDDGEGIYENDVISFDATDPNGNLIRCCLYYNSENSLCMEVEESTWTYLPTGTVIDGFDN